MAAKQSEQPSTPNPVDPTPSPKKSQSKIISSAKNPGSTSRLNRLNAAASSSTPVESTHFLRTPGTGVFKPVTPERRAMVAAQEAASLAKRRQAGDGQLTGYVVAEAQRENEQSLKDKEMMTRGELNLAQARLQASAEETVRGKGMQKEKEKGKVKERANGNEQDGGPANGRTAEARAADQSMEMDAGDSTVEEETFPDPRNAFDETYRPPGSHANAVAGPSRSKTTTTATDKSPTRKRSGRSTTGTPTKEKALAKSTTSNRKSKHKELGPVPQPSLSVFQRPRTPSPTPRQPTVSTQDPIMQYSSPTPSGQTREAREADVHQSADPKKPRKPRESKANDDKSRQKGEMGKRRMRREETGLVKKRINGKTRLVHADESESESEPMGGNEDGDGDGQRGEAGAEAEVGETQMDGIKRTMVDGEAVYVREDTDDDESDPLQEPFAEPPLTKRANGKEAEKSPVPEASPLRASEPDSGPEAEAASTTVNDMDNRPNKGETSYSRPVSIADDQSESEFQAPPQTQMAGMKIKKVNGEDVYVPEDDSEDSDAEAKISADSSREAAAGGRAVSPEGEDDEATTMDVTMEEPDVTMDGTDDTPAERDEQAGVLVEETLPPDMSVDMEDEQDVEVPIGERTELAQAILEAPVAASASESALASPVRQEVEGMDESAIPAEPVRPGGDVQIVKTVQTVQTVEVEQAQQETIAVAKDAVVETVVSLLLSVNV